MSRFITHLGGTRRRFIQNAGATVALASAGLSIPHIAKAAAPVKIGLIHPATGWAAYPAAQLRYGAQMAIADINAAGGIKSMGGAPLEALLGDSQTKPEIGAAEVEKMNEAGVHALQGCYQSAVGLAASAAAAKYNILFSVDVGVSDKLVGRGFRMSSAWLTAMAGLPATPRPISARSTLPRSPADGRDRSRGIHPVPARCLTRHWRSAASRSSIPSSTPTRRGTSTTSRCGSSRRSRTSSCRSTTPANGASAKTLRQQRVDFMTSFSVLGGGFNFKFIDDMLKSQRI